MEFFYYPEMNRDVGESIVKLMEKDQDSREYVLSYF